MNVMAVPPNLGALLVRLYVCMHVWICVCMYARMFLYVNDCLYVCMYVCMYVCHRSIRILSALPILGALFVSMYIYVHVYMYADM